MLKLVTVKVYIRFSGHKIIIATLFNMYMCQAQTSSPLDSETGLNPPCQLIFMLSV